MEQNHSMEKNVKCLVMDDHTPPRHAERSEGSPAFGIAPSFGDPSLRSG